MSAPPLALDTAQVVRALREALHARGITTPVEDGAHLFPESTKGWVRLGLLDLDSAALLVRLLAQTPDSPPRAGCES
ncbi:MULTISPECIES: hypothetical protein [Streptacidiphilus]|uniref:Uncharacterized protein n=1 Tax=Streptacidiphilus cavernicola TaxID=3342716 RepID=A0ABV6UYM1_9ACTN|nr:hypothetical protein [Streptacidiphilus jeojiense]